MVELLRKAFYLRYPIVCGLLLLALGPLALFTSARPLLANTLLLHTWWQMLALTAICLTAATLIFIQAGVILANGPERFPELKQKPQAPDPPPRGETAPPTPVRTKPIEKKPAVQETPEAGQPQAVEKTHPVEESSDPSRVAAQESGSNVAAPENLSPQESPPNRGGKLWRDRIHWDWSWWVTTLWIVVGLTIPLLALAYSAAVRMPGGGFGDTISWMDGVPGFLAGALVFLLLSLIYAFVQQLVMHPSVTIQGLFPIRIDSPADIQPRFEAVDRCLARWFAGPGYTEPAAVPRDKVIYFRPGHWQQVVFLAFVVTAYFLLRWLTRGSPGAPGDWNLPTLFYAILGLMFVSAVVAGAAFCLDYFRVPTLLILAVGWWVSYRYPQPRDHFFEVFESAQTQAPVGLSEAFGSQARKVPSDKTGQRTLVVVTAPGGGIHAAAWTAQVLTGLHQRYGENYAKSLSLISAVSGGSVGTMYYAANFHTLAELSPGDPQVRSLKADEFKQMCEAIVQRAGDSGLEAIGWGLAFYDLPAVIPFVRVGGDRGTTLDAAWQARLLLRPSGETDTTTLASWRQPARLGKMPIVVFNATEVESGRRVLFSPVTTRTRGSLATSPMASPVEFSRTYPEHDLRVVTAARLSATFPYVSPTATPRELTELGHLADGGYIDNEGILTVVDWISRFVQEYAEKKPTERPFDRVLILRIRHQVPRDPLLENDEKRLKQIQNGFLYAVFGPLEAVLTVRGTSQIERGQVEVDLATDTLEQADKQRRRSANRMRTFWTQLQQDERLDEIVAKAAKAGLPTVKELAALETDADATRIRIESAFLDFDLGPEGKDYTPPLSWKLSPREFSKYEAAWERLKSDQDAQKGLRKLDQYFAVQNE